MKKSHFEVKNKEDLKTGFNIPAALNARSSWEAVAAHFLETDHAVFLDPAHLSWGASHQLPQVNRVVIQQGQEAALSQSEANISITTSLSSF